MSRSKSKKTEMSSTLFLHINYHPDNPSSKVVQKVFRKCCLSHQQPANLGRNQNHLDKTLWIKRLILAYHQPRNIGNHFSIQNLLFEVARHERPTLGNSSRCAAL